MRSFSSLTMMLVAVCAFSAAHIVNAQDAKPAPADAKAEPAKSDAKVDPKAEPPKPSQPNTGTPSSRLYKYVDKDGKVTYSDTPPRTGEKADLVSTDKKSNIVRVLSNEERAKAGQRAPRPGEAAALSVSSTQADERRKKRDELDNAVQKAQSALNKAKEDLEFGQIPLEGEQRIVVRKEGNSVIRTEGYYARIAGLEERVKAAEKALEKAQGDFRRGP
jgi:hypothetical protein